MLAKKTKHTEKRKKILKSKRILAIKMSAERGPDFIFSLPGEAAHPCPMSVTPFSC